MRKIDQLFAEYGQSHQNKTNKSIHWFCVPLIFWSILGFISLVPAPHFCVVFYGCVSVASALAILVVCSFRPDVDFSVYRTQNRSQKTKFS